MECCAKRPALSSMEPLQMGTTRRAAGARESQDWRSGRGAMGGADHIRSSLSVVLTDAAPVSTAAVASSRPRSTGRDMMLRRRALCHFGISLAWVAQGVCYIKNQIRDPIKHYSSRAPRTLGSRNGVPIAYLESHQGIE